VLQLGILERLVIVARHDVVEVSIHVGVLRQDRHHREAFVAGRAERAEAFNVGDCHTVLVYHGPLRAISPSMWQLLPPWTYTFRRASIPP
jgi:hypothetical protein